MRVDSAKLSLAGNRLENQDRADIFVGSGATLLACVDGMGGHANGSRAAEITVSTLKESFQASSLPIFDPQGFLTLALARAHDRVVRLGEGVPLDQRPRATCAICLLQDGGAFWAHVGDSRLYHVRGGRILARTRDHSHVELLLREGLIAESEMRGHPMRNFVECCLGGDAPLPDMSFSGRRKLESGDIVLACSDGLWSGLSDEDIGKLSNEESGSLDAAIKALAELAVSRNSPHSDNTTVVVARWLE